MSEPEAMIDGSVPAVQIVSDILRPALHDHDLLQSFVRIDLDEGAPPPESRHATFAEEKDPKRYSPHRLLKQTLL